MKGGISAIAAYVPERLVTNEELSKSVDTSDEWIVSHTGIRERRLASQEQASSDLGIEAAEKVLAAAKVAPEDVDMVIAATSTPDYNPFPATACVIQDRLGCARAGAFDLQAGCTGFVYSLEVARGFLATGTARKVLVVGTEKLSSITNWEDRSTCVLFGDGAGAALLDADAEDGHQILSSSLRSDGGGDTALIRELGGSRAPFDPERHSVPETMLTMDGRRVYLFAVDAIVRTIKSLCLDGGVSVAELAWIVPHQANLRIIEAAAKRLKYPVERFYTNLDRFANTSAASIPIAMEEMEARELLNKGDLVLTVGFGAGLTYGGNLIRW
jgi:3-oxoacyl-[acyl-carrier-protein] synthase-3